MPSRQLRRPEVDMAALVFHRNLPYSKIWVYDDLGLGDRPFVEPFGGTFNMHLGPKGFKNATALGRTFVHELVHVWQGSHAFPYAYVADAVVCQCMLGNGAYDYVLGADGQGYAWDSYNAEQQAEIIADWYASGMSATSPLFKYVQHVRTAPEWEPPRAE